MSKKLNEIKAFVDNYQHSLRALISSLPKPHILALPEELATIGLAEIWPCLDGVIILIYQSDNIRILLKSHTGQSINNFLRNNDAMAFYDGNGMKVEMHPALQINIKPIPLIDMSGMKIHHNLTTVRQRFNIAMLFGWDVVLPKPDEKALEQFKVVFATRNLDVPSINISPKDFGNILLHEYRDLLKSDGKEELLQQFLKNHPEIICPDYIECHPKFKLGDDYVTDFVFLAQSKSGPEYIFVEIERTGKEIFTNNDTFSSYFTQAKDQLLNWNRWITHNQSYIVSKLNGLFKPKYHLVMGRDNKLNPEQREKLKLEFDSISFVFSTYDDLADRYSQIISNIFKAT